MNGYELLHEMLGLVVNYSVVLLELMGVAVIIFNGISSFVHYVQKRSDVKLKLAEGLAFGLELKLGSEILRTVIIREMSEIYLVAAIIILRACLTFLIHWEIKNEKLEEASHHE